MNQLTDLPTQPQDNSASPERPNAQPPSDTRVAEASAKYLAETAGTATPASPACPPGYKLTEVGVIPEDWDVSPLSRMTSLMTNGFVGTAKTHYTDSHDGITYIQGYNVEENSFNFNGIKRVTPEFHKKNSKSCLREGDVLMVQTGDVGLVTIVPQELEGANCHALIIIRFKKEAHNPHYFSYYLNSQQGRLRLKELETGTTMKHINVGDLLHFEVPYPRAKHEQTAIATALSDMDALIGGLEKLIAKKQAIKTATMQQLLTGRTRLPQFALREDGTHKGYKQSELGEIPEDWEVVPFGDVLSIRHGKNQKLVESSNGNIPILATGGQIGWANQYLWDKPSVLIGRKGTIDKPRYVDSPFWTVDTLFYSEIKSCVEPKFIFYKFCMIDWMQYNEASGVPSLNASTIESVSVSLPTKQEQTAIATILSDMDEEIQALQQRLAKTRQIKQGMMQELLTGKTRLVQP
ncbi:restriction endonuclease subunit S [Microbulbifer thermotolerans]|uniref:restriction endonuclease subunit S n=1 Tax=Microbulbifer thermotolerans TaxID=252514 RepID=UPI00224A8469|nr:restriction endonuclease subunit S [Microbulbifer thermotolerans]MCX2841298.1 restriction endonuclease subunit S [Microbulbifer thermotolerans]